MTFGFIDIVFALIVLYFIVTSSFHGLIHEVFGKLAVILGAFCAFFYCGQFAPKLVSVIDNSTVDIVLAFLIIFVVVFVAVKFIQVILGKIFSGEILGSLDKILGLLFGAVEGLLVVSCVLIIVKAQPWFDSSSITAKSTFWSFLSPFLTKPINYISGMFVK